jgi:hypothetical protein
VVRDTLRFVVEREISETPIPPKYHRDRDLNTFLNPN